MQEGATVGPKGVSAQMWGGERSGGGNELYANFALRRASQHPDGTLVKDRMPGQECVDRDSYIYIISVRSEIDARWFGLIGCVTLVRGSQN